VSYKQTLWKEIPDAINPKYLKKQNRYKKWEYGYNSEYDFAILEYLQEFSSFDSTELRYWFHDVPVGVHIVKTSWSEKDSDGDMDLQFESVEEEK